MRACFPAQSNFIFFFLLSFIIVIMIYRHTHAYGNLGDIDPQLCFCYVNAVLSLDCRITMCWMDVLRFLLHDRLSLTGGRAGRWTVSCQSTGERLCSFCGLQRLVYMPLLLMRLYSSTLKKCYGFPPFNNIVCLLHSFSAPVVVCDSRDHSRLKSSH